MKNKYISTEWLIIVQEHFFDCENNEHNPSYVPFIFDDYEDAKKGFEKIKEYLLSDENRYKGVFSKDMIKIDNESMFFAYDYPNTALDIQIKFVPKIKDITMDMVKDSICGQINKNKPSNF